MSIHIETLRDLAANHGHPVCDEVADEIEDMEKAYELLFKENAELKAALTATGAAQGDGGDYDVLKVVNEWALAGHISEKGVTGEACQAIRAAVRAQRKALTSHASEATSILTHLWRAGFFSGRQEWLPLEMRDRIAAIACAHGIQPAATKGTT